MITHQISENRKRSIVQTKGLNKCNICRITEAKNNQKYILETEDQDNLIYLPCFRY